MIAITVVLYYSIIIIDYAIMLKDYHDIIDMAMDLTKKFSKNLMFSLFLETCPTSPGPSGIADYQIAFGGETRTRETHR